MIKVLVHRIASLFHFEQKEIRFLFICNPTLCCNSIKIVLKNIKLVYVFIRKSLSIAADAFSPSARYINSISTSEIIVPHE